MNLAEQLKNMTPVEKADLAVADLTAGGVLLPQPAQRFIRLAIQQSKFLPRANVVGMTAQNGVVPTIAFTGNILKPAQEGTALPAADRSKPTFGNNEITTKLFKGEVRIPDEVLEDNIEKDQLKATIMSMMAERVGADLEQMAIMGDTASTNPTLAQFDGALKLSTSHVIDAASAGINRTILKDMLKAMPKIYRQSLANLDFITSQNAVLDLTDQLGNRQTPQGDSLLFDGSGQLRYQGVRVDEIPGIPDDLGVGTNTTDILLMDPRNFQVGIWRQIRIETYRDVSAGVTVIVVTIRIGVNFALEDAIVKAINVKTGT